MAIVVLPLAGAVIAGLFRKLIGARAAMYLTTALLVIAALLSLQVFASYAFGGREPEVIEILRWFSVGDFQASWSVRVDTLTAVMLVVVTSVSALVHLYSIGYMDHDPDQARFFAYLSLFTFAMLMLVTANDFMQLFFGWEGVGLASYLLIGFWYKKASANAAAIKAFVTNRVGDFGFALGIMAVFATFGTVQFEPIFAAIAENASVAPVWMGGQVIELSQARIGAFGLEVPALEAIAFLLFIGAMGKSAQFFLHVWLPDAMEGPTPVSALIHAATMVTAGVFLVCRCWPIYDAAPATAAFVTIIGAVTALYAATVGLAQNDIKRVVAYSTCSQLGYMFFAAGLGAYGAAMFHLFTHAFFKALLFLGSGAVIHAIKDEQDMRLMGGLVRKLPWTWTFMIIGTLALTGVGLPIGAGLGYGLSGFYSKDTIIETAFFAGEAGSQVAAFAFWIGVIAAFLTSFYSWRLIFMTFHGRYRGPRETFEHAHEAPWVMRGPLVILAAGALFAGAFFYPTFVASGAQDFWRGSVVYHGHAGRVETAQTAEVYEDAPAPVVEAAPQGAAVDAAAESELAAVPETGEIALAEAVPPEEAHGETHSDHAGEDAHHGDDHYGEHYHPHPPEWVRWSATTATIFGLLFALWAYPLNPGLAGRIAARGGPLHAFLSNKWYFDQLYNAVFVRGARALGDLFWKGGDKKVIDGLGPDGVAAASAFIGRRQSRAQSGYLYHYAFVMLLGVAALVSWLLFSALNGGGQ